MHGWIKGSLAFAAAAGSVMGSVMAGESFPKWVCVLCLAVSAGCSGVLALFTDVPTAWLDRFGPKAPTPEPPTLAVIDGEAQGA